MTARDERAKKPNETSLQWQMRIAELDSSQRDHDGPLITSEAERHGDYRDEFVMHIETQTLARTKRNRQASPFVALYENGTIDKDQFGAALEIAMVAEMRTRPVSMRTASMEARVDNSGAGRDELIERLSAVQMEVAYSRWRDRLPMPRRLYIDMITGSGSLFSKARHHGVGWPRARARLISSLDRWIDIRAKVAQQIDEDELAAAHARLRASKKKGLARES